MVIILILSVMWINIPLYATNLPASSPPPSLSNSSVRVTIDHVCVISTFVVSLSISIPSGSWATIMIVTTINFITFAICCQQIT